MSAVTNKRTFSASDVSNAVAQHAVRRQTQICVGIQSPNVFLQTAQQSNTGQAQRQYS